MVKFFLQTSVVQPPTKTVPPLIIAKPKPEKRQRKTASSKSRTSKVKSSSSLSSATETSQTLAHKDAAATGLAGVLASPPPAINLGVMHPALKDTKLSPPGEMTDEETVNSLLTTLFKRSLDPKKLSSSTKSLTSSLPPQKSSSQSNKKARHSAQSHFKVVSSEANRPSSTTTGKSKPSFCQ